jgi:hypothetical protein
MNMSKHTFQPDNEKPRECRICGRREGTHNRARMNSESTRRTYRREHRGGRVLRVAS